MKLLDWMHRKFWQNTSDTATKDILIGNSCTCFPGFAGRSASEDGSRQSYRKTSNCGCNEHAGKFNADKIFNYCCRGSFESFDSARVETKDDNLEEDRFEVFHGFLTIGTLGTEPATPTFFVYVDRAAETETDEAIKNKVKLVDGELEKVLGDEGRAEWRNAVLGRDSHDSAGRVSGSSTITLGGNEENGESCGSERVDICPLEGYHFGSAVDMPLAVQKEPKPSLKDLFQKTNQVEENQGTKLDMVEKTRDKYAADIMRKMTKKSGHAWPRKRSTSSTIVRTKLHKILHFFDKKVHPETSCDPANKHYKNKVKKNGHILATNSGPSTQDFITCPPLASLKGSCNGDSVAANELWVKTDAEYLVLEL